MYKKIFTLILITAAIYASITGCKTTQSALTAKEGLQASHAITLKMPSGDGTNGAGVAYHKGSERWYAVFAGNSYFPLAIFDKSGKIIDGNQKAQFDARGFWYNENTKKIEGNGYGSEGIVGISLDSKGMTDGYDIIFYGDSHQPSPQSVGAYDPSNDEILYFHDGSIERYDRKSGDRIGTLGIKDALNPYDLNETTLVYTGIKNGEIGILNYKTGKILLISKSSGRQTGSISLPSDAPMPDMFNFSYSGGFIWLFDINTRIWHGYKVK